MAMDRFIRTTTLLFLLFCILVVLQFHPAAPEGGQNVDQNTEKPFLSKLVTDTVALLRKSHQSSWEKIKTVIHDMQMQFSPPNLDFRGTSGDSGKGTVKDAVGKSFGQSKETVEESAKSAAKVVGDAIHKTTEKVKDSAQTESDEAEL